MQTSLDAEAIARDDLAKVLAIEADRAGLNGNGQNNCPTGVMQMSNVNTVSLGTNGGAPTWQAMCQMEEFVSNYNADFGSLALVTNPAGRSTLKQAPKIGTTFPVYLWEDNEVNGYPAVATNQIPSNLTKGSGTNLSAAIFGNWEELVFAMWGGTDIIVDPYTGSSSGTLRIVMLQDLDIQSRYQQAFSIIVDMVTT